MGKWISVPEFPLPLGWYFGPKKGPRCSVSGRYRYNKELCRWQAQMKKRGWIIEVTGIYDDQTNAVTKDFQLEKSLIPDGKIGQATWYAAWTAPIT